MMDEVFPVLTMLPDKLANHLQEMVDLLVCMVSKGPLPPYNDLKEYNNDQKEYKGVEYIYRVYDSTKKLRCLLKTVDDEDETLARKEAVVYLLDHPLDGLRSESSTVYGFCGVPPTVFVKYRDENGENKMGVLVEYVETVSLSSVEINNEEIQKIALVDVRFGNKDRNRNNILTRLDEDGTPRLVPIDHEHSFNHDIQPYNICGPCWLKIKSFGDAHAAFSSACVEYVNKLDPLSDLGFIRRCGWDPGASYEEQFTIFTVFLKKAVLRGLTAYNIGMIASCKCETPMFNLQAIVNSVDRNAQFVENVCTRIERLRDYDFS